MTLLSRDNIACAFGAKAVAYDRLATLQRKVASTLAGHLPLLRSDARVLEIGCGTGFLTAHLLEIYPHASITVTDVSLGMLDLCQDKFSGNERLSFSVMDGEYPEMALGKFDLIVSSMAVQWFSDTLAGFSRISHLLAEGGRFYFSAPGPQCLQEWQECFEYYGFSSGLVRCSEMLPGVFLEHMHVVDYGSAAALLNGMKAIGAGVPKTGYKPLSFGQFKQICNRFKVVHGAVAKWHIVYGCL